MQSDGFRLHIHSINAFACLPVGGAMNVGKGRFLPAHLLAVHDIDIALQGLQYTTS